MAHWTKQLLQQRQAGPLGELCKRRGLPWYLPKKYLIKRLLAFKKRAAQPRKRPKHSNSGRGGASSQSQSQSSKRSNGKTRRKRRRQKRKPLDGPPAGCVAAVHGASTAPRTLLRGCTSPPLASPRRPHAEEAAAARLCARRPRGVHAPAAAAAAAAAGAQRRRAGLRQQPRLTFRLHSDCIQTTCRLQTTFGSFSRTTIQTCIQTYIRTTSRLHSDCIQTAPRLHPDRIQATFRLHPHYRQTAFGLQCCASHAERRTTPPVPSLSADCTAGVRHLPERARWAAQLPPGQHALQEGPRPVPPPARAPRKAAGQKAATAGRRHQDHQEGVPQARHQEPPGQGRRPGRLPGDQQGPGTC